MGREAQPPASIRNGPAQIVIDKKVSNRSSNHKVVLESVTQEKKKLRSVVCCFLANIVCHWANIRALAIVQS
jgi:hypothetical protein